MLVEQGYEVHLTYRRSAGKAEELMEKYAGKVFGHRLDQGKIEEIEKADFLTERMVRSNLQRCAWLRHCKGICGAGRSSQGCQ
ncbi:MAG: hypothetical protein ACLTK0_07265 [Anaerovoracaceae bacterium]